MFLDGKSKQITTFNGDWNRLLKGPTKPDEIPPIDFPGKNGNGEHLSVRHFS